MVPSTRKPWTCFVVTGEARFNVLTHRNCSGGHPLPTLAKKVRGIEQLPDVPQPSGKKGAEQRGRPQYEHRRWGAFVAPSSDNLPRPEAGLESIVALQRPKHPRDEGRLARSQKMSAGGTPWSRLRHLRRDASWSAAKRVVSSGWTSTAAEQEE